nr:dammarenediol II synthase-like [Ipomoea trifida]
MKYGCESGEVSRGANDAAVMRRGLAAAGKNYENSEAICKAVHFYLSKQNQEGGCGECLAVENALKLAQACSWTALKYAAKVHASGKISWKTLFFFPRELPRHGNERGQKRWEGFASGEGMDV